MSQFGALGDIHGAFDTVNRIMRRHPDIPFWISVGDLADDWEFVSRLLQEANAPVAYQLTELAPLLAYLGEVLARDLGEEGG